MNDFSNFNELPEQLNWKKLDSIHNLQFNVYNFNFKPG